MSNPSPLSLAGHIRRPCPFIGLFLAAIILSACQAGGSTQAVLPDDGPPIQFSQTASGSFLRKLVTAGQSTAAGGEVRLNLSQEEVTSFLSLSALLSQDTNLQDLDPQMQETLQGLYGVDSLGELANSPQAGEPGAIGRLRDLLSSQGEGGFPLNLSSLRPKLIEPQVYFKGDGRVILRGYGGLLRWQIPTRLVLSPRVDGGLKLDFQEAQLGTIPLPVGLLNWAGDLLARAIPDDLNLAAIREVRVTEGNIFLSGTIRQVISP